MAAEPDILFVTRKWPPATGGMETYSLKLTQALARQEPVDLIILPGKPDGMPPGLLALLGFPFTVLARYLQRRTAPRAVHLGDMAIWPLALPATLWRGTRIVLSAHGTDVAYPRRGGIRGHVYGAYLRLGARLLRRAKVIANSRATEAATRETGWRDIAVVRLGTDFPASRLPVAHGRKLLFAGRLIKRKGLGWFVREVLPRLPADITLDVAGSGWDDDEKRALGDPRVTYLGDLDQQELARAFASALCAVVPNIELANGEYEGFGLVAVEAASAGGVVLAADHGGLRDAVIDGETGFLLAAGDAEAWAAKVNEIAAWSAEAKNTFSARATLRAREVFNWDRVADETLAVYGPNSA